LIFRLLSDNIQYERRGKMPTLSARKEAYYLAVDNTDYPQSMKKYIKKLISNCASPEEIFQLTLFYLYNCQTA